MSRYIRARDSTLRKSGKIAGWLYSIARVANVVSIFARQQAMSKQYRMNSNWTYVPIKAWQRSARWLDHSEQKGNHGLFGSATINSPPPRSLRIFHLPPWVQCISVGVARETGRYAFWYRSDLYTHYHPDRTLRGASSSLLCMCPHNG